MFIKAVILTGITLVGVPLLPVIFRQLGWAKRLDDRRRP